MIASVIFKKKKRFFLVTNLKQDLNTQIMVKKKANFNGTM